MEALFLVQNQGLLAMSSQVEGAGGSLEPLFQALIPFVKLCPPDLSTSQRPHPLTPSPWGVKIQHMNLGGHIQTTLSSLGGLLGDHLNAPFTSQSQGNQTSPELGHLEKKRSWYLSIFSKPLPLGRGLQSAKRLWPEVGMRVEGWGWGAA